MTGKSKYQSNYFHTSKALSKFLRHSALTYLFDSDGTVNIGSTFNELGPQNPTQCHMSPRDFAAMLIGNDKQRFQISAFVKWTWKPFGFPPTQPYDLKLGAVQGHSNKTVNPYDLGWTFHVTSADNRRSIERKGLLKDPRGGKGHSGRDSVHFMYHNDNSNGYIRMADGTTVPNLQKSNLLCLGASGRF